MAGGRIAWERGLGWVVRSWRQAWIWNDDVAEEDQLMHGLRPAIDRTGCWRIGVGDVYH